MARSEAKKTKLRVGEKLLMMNYEAMCEKHSTIHEHKPRKHKIIHLFILHQFTVSHAMIFCVILMILQICWIGRT